MRELTQRLPHYSYLYYGDNANAPYGIKSPAEIYELTQQGIEYLFQEGAQLILLACNTASATALRRLQQEWLPHHYPAGRVLGIVVPTIEQITGVSWQQTTPLTTPVSAEQFTIGILATPATVSSNAYPTEVHKRNPSIRVVQQACPGLVEAIEAGAEDKALKLISRYSAQLQKEARDIRAVLLGCTHYAVFADAIRQYFPATVKVFEQPQIVVESVIKYLKRHPELEQRIAREKTNRFVTSGDPKRVSIRAMRYFGSSLHFEALEAETA